MGALRRSKRERLLLQLEMAEGGSAVEALVELTLDAERHGVYLQGGLVEPLLKHLVHTLNVKRVPRDLPESLEEWMKCAEEAFEADSKELPGAFEVRLRRWVRGDGLGLGGAASTKEMPPTKSVGGLLGGKGSYDLIGIELGMTSMAVEEQFGEHNIDLHTRPHAVSDMKAQGMSLTQILALTVGLETGKLHPVADVSGFTYGTDIRTCELVTRLKKAGVATLSSLLKEGKVVPVVAHLNSLLRDFSLHGQMREAALLSSWLQEWQQMFVGEETVAIAYLTEYFRTYPGRGLPTEFDFRIFFRVQKAYGASGSEATKEVGKSVKALQGQVSQLQDQCSSYKKKIDLLQESVKRSGGPKGLTGGKVGPCHICGEMGHLAAACPERKDKDD